VIPTTKQLPSRSPWIGARGVAVPSLHLYRFRYFDPLRNRWLMERYAAERKDIEQRYAQYELIEPPEARHLAIVGDPRRRRSTRCIFWRAACDEKT
jgi:hypothetical protein